MIFSLNSLFICVILLDNFLIASEKSPIEDCNKVPIEENPSTVFVIELSTSKAFSRISALETLEYTRLVANGFKKRKNKHKIKTLFFFMEL